MAKPSIQFLSKSYSIIAEKTIETKIIPGIGEIINARQFLELPEG